MDAPACPSEASLLACAIGAVNSDQAQDIAKHLLDCGRCAEWVRERSQTSTSTLRPALPATDATAALNGAVRTADPELQTGTQLGKYVIVGKLGQGGMGVVYSANDVQLNRKVAVKLLHASSNVDSAQGHARLLREAQALAQLHHPNVVAVYDVGTHGNSVFMAMEFVQGRTLRKWVQEKPRRWQEILGIFLAAGEGLLAAHRAGIIHRDFKPENVLIGEDGRPFVMDFGIATQRTEESPDARPRGAESGPPGSTPDVFKSSLTTKGSVVGTLAYMAPELLQGHPADPCSDGFAFAVSLYEALYGRRPFPRVSLHHRDRWKLHPPPRTGVPTRLRSVLLKALSLKPEARYPSPERLLAELRAIPIRRRRIAVGFATVGGAAALLVASSVWHGRTKLCQSERGRLTGIWDESVRSRLRQTFLSSGLPSAQDTWGRTASLLDAYSEAWLNGRQSACAATRIQGTQSEEVLDLRMNCLDRRLSGLAALTELLGQANAATVQNSVKAASSLAPFDLCANVTALRAPVKPPEDRATAAKVDQLRKDLAKAKAQLDSGQYRDAYTTANAAREFATTLAYKPLEAEARLLLAEVEEKLGDFEKAVQELEPGLLAAVAGGDREAAARVAARLAIEEMYLHHSHNARNAGDYALAELTHLGGSPVIEAQVHTGFGWVAMNDHQAETAVTEFKRVLELRQKALGPDHVDVGGAYGNLSTALTYWNHPKEGYEAGQRSIEVLGRALGPSHPLVGRAHFNAAVQLGDTSPREALTATERALAILTPALGPDHPDFAVIWEDCSRWYDTIGEPDKAVAAWKRQQEIYEKQFGRKSVQYALALNRGAELFTGLGEPKKAFELAREAAEISERLGADAAGTWVISIYLQGNALAAWHRASDAEKTFHHALDVAAKLLPADGEELTSALDSLADFYMSQGSPKMALPLYQREHDILLKKNGTQSTSLTKPCLGLAQAQLKLGMVEASRANVDAGLALLEDPQLLVERAGLRFVRAKLEWKAGKHDEAIKEAQAARTTLPSEGRVPDRIRNEIATWIKASQTA